MSFSWQLKPHNLKALDNVFDVKTALKQGLEQSKNNISTNFISEHWEPIVINALQNGLLNGTEIGHNLSIREAIDHAHQELFNNQNEQSFSTDNLLAIVLNDVIEFYSLDPGQTTQLAQILLRYLTK
jgi:hypothetical protein